MSIASLFKNLNEVMIILQKMTEQYTELCFETLDKYGYSEIMNEIYLNREAKKSNTKYKFKD